MKKRNILKRNSGFIVGCALVGVASFFTADAVMTDMIPGLKLEKETEEPQSEKKAELEPEQQETVTYETDPFTVMASGSVIKGIENEDMQSESESEPESETQLSGNDETEESQPSTPDVSDSAGETDSYVTGESEDEGGSNEKGDTDHTYTDDENSDEDGSGSESGNGSLSGDGSGSDGESWSGDGSGNSDGESWSGDGSGSNGESWTGDGSGNSDGSWGGDGSSDGSWSGDGSGNSDGSWSGDGSGSNGESWTGDGSGNIGESWSGDGSGNSDGSWSGDGSGNSDGSWSGDGSSDGSDDTSTPWTPEDVIIQGISSRYIDISELYNYNQGQLRLIRNEIFALHGRIFNSQDLADYFSQKSWYVPTYSPEEFDANMFYYLNDYEEANLQLILDYEAALGY